MSHIEQLAETDEQKQQPARGFDSYGLVACLVISIFSHRLDNTCE